RPPTACDASSTILKPYDCASVRISAISHDWPPKCTGTRTFGSVPSRAARSSLAARAAVLMLYVRGSTSTKSTSAPQYKPQLAEATNEFGDVQSRSPGPRSSARHATWSADVAELTATP